MAIMILFALSSIILLTSNAVGAENDLSLTYEISNEKQVQDNNDYIDTRSSEEIYMTKHMLSPNVKCNDGSPAGFYLRRSNSSKMWIVFLEEGWCCYDEQSCDERWKRASILMSSKQWPDTRTVGGILSGNAAVNPYWWNENHVFVPYCTSDIWSGRRIKPLPGSKFTFMGAIVIKEVVRELLTMGLADANSLVLSGSSAGGIGVMLNVDPIQKMLKQYTGISVHGITDSGWFLDQQPYIFSEDRKRASIDIVKQGIHYWHSQIPCKCRNLYAPEEHAKCFIGYIIYPTISTPLFVFQWLYDEFQLKNDMGNFILPTRQHWDYIHNMGLGLRKSLLNVTAVFAPSCISHTVLTDNDWKNIKIDSVSLPSALQCWIVETRYTKNNHKCKPSKTNVSNNNTGGGRRQNKRLTKVDKKTSTSENALKKKQTARHNNTQRVRDDGDKTHKKHRRHQKIQGGCRHQYIQNCTWPQCNISCPKLTNPVTGEQIVFLDLLKSFGMKMPKLSSELGIDMESLLHMDQIELLKLLTPHAN